ncbi:hypothetical protein ACBJ59_57085 [Nonomuraea sp. MTCD27]|uniref:hypothetical protein n=1 Tax=Nonomuraea sp. MTCD27 TaxID=1676747 RepID=UPI0035BF6410
MGTESFYVTAAQVLPTLMIALAVESGFILRSLQRNLMEMKRESPATQDARESVRMMFGFAVVFAVVFAVGEVLAFLAIGFRWFNGWTFFVIGACLVVMILGVVLVPLFRFAATAE